MVNYQCPVIALHKEQPDPTIARTIAVPYAKRVRSGRVITGPRGGQRPEYAERAPKLVRVTVPTVTVEAPPIFRALTRSERRAAHHQSKRSLHPATVETHGREVMLVTVETYVRLTEAGIARLPTGWVNDDRNTRGSREHARGIMPCQWDAMRSPFRG